MASISASSSQQSSHQSKNCFTARVRYPHVAIMDTGGKEFDEAAAGVFLFDANNRRQRRQVGADWRGRRYNLGLAAWASGASPSHFPGEPWSLTISGRDVTGRSFVSN
jgi:hypothetical protein